MTKKNLIKYTGFFVLVLLFITLSPHQAEAQNQEVTIIAPYKPTISDVFKKSLNPVPADTIINAPPVSYSIKSQAVYTPYNISSIKPALINVDLNEEMRRNYLRAGMGNYTMPYLELFTNSLGSDDFSIGFHARHLSSRGRIEDYGTSNFSQNNASLFIKRYLKEKMFSGKIYYKRDVVHYYGFKPDEYINDSISDDDLRQRFSLIAADLNILSSKKRDDKLNYMAGLKFYHLSDLHETGEFKIGLNSNFNSKNEFFDFVDKQELGADAKFDFYQNTDSLTNWGTGVLEMKPYVRLNLEFLDLTLGVKAIMTTDTTTEFYIYPELRASYQVIPDYLRFYAAIDGGLHRNSYQNVSDENPWVDPLFPLGFTSTRYNFNGGVTGKINSLLDYNFSVLYADVENMLFYVNDFSAAYNPKIQQNFGNKFTGVYDDALATTISIELGYRQTGLFNIIFKASYHDYQLKTQTKAWHKPAFEALVSGKYLFTDRISFSGDVFFTGTTYTQTIENGIATTGKNKAYVDLNMGVEYRFTDRISAFANLNNITATRQFKWYNYPSQRMNVMGGFTFSF